MSAIANVRASAVVLVSMMMLAATKPNIAPHTIPKTALLKNSAFTVHLCP
jgi:hypothetical protein